MLNQKQINFLKGHGLSINGDLVTGIVSPKKIGFSDGFVDKERSLFVRTKADDMGTADHRKKYLGLVSLAATSGLVDKGYGYNFVKNNAVLELDSSDQVVSYDIAIPSTGIDGFKVIKDSDDQGYGAPVGVGGSPFYVYLDKAPTAQDELKFDLSSGYQVRVLSTPDSVVSIGEGFKVWIEYQSENENDEFPLEALKEGAIWEKVGHFMGEYDTIYSNISGAMEAPGYMNLEWRLGSRQGVEVGYTMQGGNIKTYGANELSNNAIKRYNEKIQELSMGGEKRTHMVTGRFSEGKFELMSITNMLEVMCFVEAYTMEAKANMFASARSYVGEGGRPIYINEGLWHQYRRGKIIKYSNPNGLTVGHLSQAVNYLNMNKKGEDLSQKVTVFRCGTQAYNLGKRLIQKYGMDMINTTPDVLVGNQGYLQGKGFITGNASEGLDVYSVKINSAELPGAGRVKFVLDTALDYSPNSTGVTSRDGFIGAGGFNKMSYTLIAEDSKANIRTVNKVKGASLIENAIENSPIYYVKPKDPEFIVWGSEHGRMNQGSQFGGVVSSLKHMGNQFWVHLQSGMLMLDTTAGVVIELDGTWGK